MEPSRQILSHLHRVIIKVGTSVITQEDGSVALGRIGHIVEQIADLRRSGKDVLLVTSGAVGIGTLKLNQQAVLSTPLRNHISGGGYSFSPNVRCFAAAGQSSLMALYEILFSQKQVSVAQILLTDDDFFCKERTENMRDTLEGLMHLGVVPILNENDVSSRKITINEGSKILFDNDSLAMLVAKELHADLLILLSNVDGVCVEPPSEQNPHPKTIPTITPETSKTISVNINGKSRCGRGGMQAKIEAALNALEASRAVVIASGLRPDVITEIMAGKVVGTLFVSHSEVCFIDVLSQRLRKNKAIDVENNAAESCEEMALKVRAASRVLRNLKPEERAKIIERIADDLLDNEAIILQENQKDVEAAAENNIQQSLRSRLVLTSKKLKTLAKGIRQIAHSADPVGKSISKKEIAEGLVLEKKTVPIGVLLIIFESRPDALPQIAALAIKSGNGLILKGGKEAVHSNAILHHIIVNAVTAETQQLKGSDLITLITSRRDVSDLLKLDQQYIDLVIPRGSSALVKYVKNSTQIPVLGHAEGICHVYIDKEADFEKAKKIVVDAKTDYPSACNAVETILIHSSIPRSQVEELLFDVLSNEHNVNLFGGPRLVSTYKSIPRTNSFQHEYGDLSVTVELVDSADEAIEHINTNSSAHTDVIVTEDKDTANQFLNEVDSACVFHNCSSRFADGYRFGLGAEVGISTSRIHARGPVGVEGLTTTQWTLISSSLDPNSNIVSSYSKGEKQFNFVDEL